MREFVIYSVTGNRLKPTSKCENTPKMDLMYKVQYKTPQIGTLCTRYNLKHKNVLLFIIVQFENIHLFSSWSCNFSVTNENRILFIQTNNARNKKKNKNVLCTSTVVLLIVVKC